MIKKILFTVLAVAITAGCGRKAETEDARSRGALKVYTTIAPIHFVTRQLLGEKDRIMNTCPPGEDEPTYIPPRSVLMDMLKADVIILNGASFEEWLEAVSLPASRLFDSSLNFKDQWLTYEGIVHSHGGQDDHSHEGYNGHTWLSPHFFIKQTTAIYEKLKSLLTEEEQQARNLSENFNVLSGQLAALDDKARTVFTPLNGTTVAATHPTYDYVAKAYGFEVFNLDIDPNEDEVGEKVQRQLDLLTKKMQGTPIRFLLWEEEPSDALKTAVGAMNLVNVVFPPIAGMEDPDYLTGMEEALAQIAVIFKGNHEK
jgi:zinc transport system substrate-binding protein